MKNIGTIASEVLRRVQAVARRSFYASYQSGELMEYGKKQLGSKYWLRGILAVVLLGAGGLAIYWTGGADAENTAGGARINREDSDRLVARESQRLDIKGLEEAAAAKALGDPFSPNHYSAGSIAVKEKKSLKGMKQLDKDTAKATSRQKKELVVPANSLPQSPAEQSRIYLQGIIDMDGKHGALLNWQGQNKFLLAGESWQGYAVEGIEENNIVLGGHRLNVGESLLI